jgi:hypothetical protein
MQLLAEKNQLNETGRQKKGRISWPLEATVANVIVIGSW